MKILFVTPEFPPKIVGGLGIYSKQIVNGLVNAGHQVTVVTYIGDITSNFEISVEEISSNLSIYRYSYSASSDYDYYNSFYWASEEALRKEKYFDIIQINDYHTFLCGIQFKKKYPNTKVISVFHITYLLYIIQGCDKFPQYYESLAWKIDQRDKNILNLENEIVKVSHRIITVSKAMKKIIESVYGASSDVVKAVHNGIDLNDYVITPTVDVAAVRNSIALPDEKIILFVGRFVEQKGLDTFFDMEKTFLDSGINYRFVLIGSGMDVTQFIGKSKAPFRITLCGFKKTHEIAQIMNCGDVLIVPSLYEPFGIVAIEGLACKIPVIVADVDGLSEIIEDGVDGFKVGYTTKKKILPFDPNEKDVPVRVFSGKDFAEKAIKILKDEKISLLFKENGFKKVSERFNITNIVMNTIKVYKSIKIKSGIIASTSIILIVSLFFFSFYLYRTVGVYKGILEPYDVVPIVSKYDGFVKYSSIINGKYVPENSNLLRIDTDEEDFEKKISLMEKERNHICFDLEDEYNRRITEISKSYISYNSKYERLLQNLYKCNGISDANYKTKIMKIKNIGNEIIERKLNSTLEKNHYQNQITVAEKNMKMIEFAIKKKIIKVPQSGIVINRNLKTSSDDVGFYVKNVSIGNFIRSGENICYIWEGEKLKVSFKIPERDIKRLKISKEISIKIKTGLLTCKRIKSSISYMAQSADKEKNIMIYSFVDLNRMNKLTKPELTNIEVDIQVHRSFI